MTENWVKIVRNVGDLQEAIKDLDPKLPLFKVSISNRAYRATLVAKEGEGEGERVHIA